MGDVSILEGVTTYDDTRSILSAPIDDRWNTGTRDEVINYYRVDKECRWGPMILEEGGGGGAVSRRTQVSVVIDRLIDSFPSAVPDIKGVLVMADPIRVISIFCPSVVSRSILSSPFPSAESIVID